MKGEVMEHIIACSEICDGEEDVPASAKCPFCETILVQHLAFSDADHGCHHVIAFYGNIGDGNKPETYVDPLLLLFKDYSLDDYTDSDGMLFMEDDELDSLITEIDNDSSFKSLTEVMLYVKYTEDELDKVGMKGWVREMMSQPLDCSYYYLVDDEDLKKLERLKPV